MSEKKEASKAQQQAAQQPVKPAKTKPARSPKDLPPAGTNGIESRTTINRWFGLGGRETHTVYAPSEPVPFTKDFKAKPGQPATQRIPATERFRAQNAPTQPAPAPPVAGRVPATEKFKAKPAKGTIFDNDIAAHRQSQGLPPAPSRGPAKGGPAKGGGPSR